MSGGYSANLLLGTVDPLLSGITQQAAQIIDPTYIVGAEANWYFMFASTFLITILGYLITEKLWNPSWVHIQVVPLMKMKIAFMLLQTLPTREKALFWASVTFWGLAAILALMVVPENGILRNQETGLVSNSPFLKVLWSYFVFFAVPGIVYGYIAKTMLG